MAWISAPVNETILKDGNLRNWNSFIYKSFLHFTLKAAADRNLEKTNHQWSTGLISHQKLHLAKGEDEGDEDDDPVHL